MRYGLIADIHANLPALEATLRHLDELGVDRVLCAGDIVGYGPHPNECVELLRARDVVAVAGNHDLMAVGRLGEERARHRARRGVAWTRRVLDEPARAYLAALPLTAEVGGRVLLAHGSIDDPDERIRTPDAARRELERVAATHPAVDVLVLGNTHHQLCVDRLGRALHAGGDGWIALSPDIAQLVNPGSVGQSRDRSPAARAALLDMRERRLQLITVAYDIERVRADLVSAGLPETNYHRPGISPLDRLRRRVARRMRASTR